MAARGAQEITSFLLVLTGQPVVTLSSAGRARISLKHGLGVPNPYDLISLPPVLFYRARASLGGPRTHRDRECGGYESIFMLLSEAQHHDA
ncbi:MAG TPA: hypothetical protein VNE38_03140 [Ktedonobacteraceae bacterium]|nr:hypothetical protein [Ktedonobacteraceae bacterium]